eukprot:472039-Amorphochlora_amoeboformis.AAC.2
MASLNPENKNKNVLESKAGEEAVCSVENLKSIRGEIRKGGMAATNAVGAVLSFIKRNKDSLLELNYENEQAKKLLKVLEKDVKVIKQAMDSSQKGFWATLKKRIGIDGELQELLKSTEPKVESADKIRSKLSELVAKNKEAIDKVQNNINRMGAVIVIANITMLSYNLYRIYTSSSKLTETKTNLDRLVVGLERIIDFIPTIETTEQRLQVREQILKADKKVDILGYKLDKIYNDNVSLGVMSSVMGTMSMVSAFFFPSPSAFYVGGSGLLNTMGAAGNVYICWEVQKIRPIITEAIQLIKLSNEYTQGEKEVPDFFQDEDKDE